MRLLRDEKQSRESVEAFVMLCLCHCAVKKAPSFETKVNESINQYTGRDVPKYFNILRHFLNSSGCNVRSSGCS